MSDRYDDGRGMSMLIAGFGLGTLVGTVIGMLIAPKSGRELRGDIADYSKNYYDKAKEYSREAYDAGRAKAREAYESGKGRAKEYSAKVGEKISDAKEHLTDAASRLTTSVKSGVDAIKEKAEDQD